MLRRSLPETLHAPDGTTGVTAAPPNLRPFAPLIVYGLMMLMAGTIGSYVGSYMTTFALTTLHLPATVAFGVIIVNGGFAVLFEPLSGWLSDRFGRKPVMLIPGAILLLAIYPAFWLISQHRTPLVFYAAIAVVTILQSLSTPPVVTTLIEQLPKQVRSGVVSIVYAFAISIFGGSTGFTLTWLIAVSHGNALMPAYYWLGAQAIGLVAMALVKESAPVKMRR